MYKLRAEIFARVEKLHFESFADILPLLFYFNFGSQERI